MMTLQLFALVLTFLQFTTLTRADTPGVENMEIPDRGAGRGTVNHTYQVTQQDDLNKGNAPIKFSQGSTQSTQQKDLNKGNAPIKFSQGSTQSTQQDHPAQPGPPECSVCDEMLPPPELVSSNSEHQSVHRTRQPIPRSRSGGTDCCRVKGSQVDCTGCSLTDIPQTLDPNITRLLLGHNAITDKSLSPGIFKRYSGLTVLNLSTNKITSLEDDIFEGLPVLKCLCLQYNPIKMDESLNSTLAFQPLNGSLVYLRLNGLNKDTDSIDLIYPSHALSFLPNLKYLFINGIPFTRFENPWQQLPKLTHLVMAGFRYGHCNLTSLQSEIFEFITLTYLDISDCNIQGRYVNRSAFENLKNLQSLSISNNFDFGLERVGEMMYGLRNNKNFKNLTMQRINPRFSPCIVIYNHTLRHFQNTGLERIEAMDNKIEMIERGALLKLPKTLKFVNLTNNKIVFGNYIQDLGSLTGLTQLALDRTKESFGFPFVYPRNLLSNCAKNYSRTLHSTTAFTRKHEDLHIKKIPVPPKLNQLSMYRNGLAYTLNNMTFSTPNNLSTADLGLNIFQYLDGPIKGLENLEYLKMDLCLIKFISCDFFDHFPKLRNLSLNDNSLGKTFEHDHHGCLFKNLSSLTSLTLARCDIFHVLKFAFKGLNALENLDVSENRIGSLRFTISHMKNLKFLNLQKNQIQTLSPQTREEINEINKGHKTLKIDLSFNPIRCDCDNLDFLEWFSDTILVNHNFSNDYYYCSSVLQPNGYDDVLMSLRRECIEQNTLFAVVISATLIAMLAIMGVLAYRFRYVNDNYADSPNEKTAPLSRIARSSLRFTIISLTS